MFTLLWLAGSTDAAVLATALYVSALEARRFPDPTCVLVRLVICRPTTRIRRTRPLLQLEQSKSGIACCRQECSHVSFMPPLRENCAVPLWLASCAALQELGPSFSRQGTSKSKRTVLKYTMLLFQSLFRHFMQRVAELQ